MKLTEHFTLDELIHSQAAARLKLSNTPSPEIVSALTKLAHGLEMVRALVQCPIVVSSGYRSPKVNAAVGGSRTSQHMSGNAADITAPGHGSAADLMQAITSSIIPFDQCLLEFNSWVHISFSSNPRRQALVIDHDGTRAYA